MNDDPWFEELKKRQAEAPDEQGPADDEWADAGTCDDPAASFIDQIMRGSWPVRMPLTLEIYAEGSRPQVHPLGPGQQRRRADSRMITLVLEFNRAKVRELMLEQFHSPHDPGDSKLPDIIPLARVDRQCFLETAAAHFKDLLAKTDTDLRRDAWLVECLRELNDYEGDLIPDLVAETISADRAAGARLRDVILDTVSDPQAREHLGWLAAAAISERLQEL